MNLEYTYWYFEDAISPEICDRIIEIGKRKSLKLGETNRRESKGIDDYTEEDLEDLIKVRNSHIAWLDIPWIYHLNRKYISIANKNAGWNFDWDYTEQCQFTTYSPGQFYDWHPDQHTFVYPEESGEQMVGKYRKLSSTLLLNDPSEFEGGELEFHTNRDKTFICKELSKKGSLVVFPSFVYHRVNPVSSGTRYSLVTWNLGPPFK